MALDDLYETFEFLRKRIEQHRDYLSADETRTRQVLIDPLLKELGWDVGDPSAVELEHRIEKPFGGKGNYKPDYALMHGGEPAAVVEAKVLGSNYLDDANKQVYDYADAEAIPYGIATDGDEWRLIDVLKPVKAADKVTVLFKITDDDVSKCALKSLALWRPNICAEDGPVDAHEPVLVETNGTIVDAGDTDDSGGESVDDGDWMPFADVKFTGPRPTQVRIDKGDSLPVRSWRQLYVQVAKHLVDKGRIHSGNVPFGLARSTKLAVTTDAVHRDGSPFSSGIAIGNGFWLERQNTPERAVDYSKRLLRHCIVELEWVEVIFE